MSRVDELIAELAPEGVEIKTLGDVGQFVRGNGLQKSDLTDEGAPAIHYGQVHTHYGVWADTTKSFTDPEYAGRLRRAKHGDLVIATTSEDDAAVAKATAWLGESEAAVSGDAYIYRHELDPKYVAYFFGSTMFQDQKARHITGTKVRRVSGDALAKIRIPVPPIEVQREIAGILDKFTRLEAELEAELEARRNQYVHYRRELLDLGVETPLGALGDLARNLDSRRKPVTKGARTSGDIPYYGASGVVDYVSGYIFDGDYLLVSEDGANLLARSTPIAFSITGKTWVNNHAHVLEFETYAERRFVEIYLNSIDLAPFVSGAAQPKLNKANLNRIPVPNPPIEEKQRIVALLDKFDTLVNDLSVGLPAEITARRKQYAFYRDKLLAIGEAAA
ncbi:restriction endonuclease subunit S [Agromyces tropicus]|uniref:Restriction endonuclease subunit S n=1 Tax=Agromyces tropicus TaxID=555371 RepID=A0ABN2TV65_9MICO